MSGFSDVFYKTSKTFYAEDDDERVLPPGLDRTKAMREIGLLTGDPPPLLFRPCQVWEVRGADITVSPVHKAAVGHIAEHPERGLSLRFPRFIRERPDKTIHEATTSAEILSRFKAQAQRQVLAGEDKDNGDGHDNDQEYRDDADWEI